MKPQKTENTDPKIIEESASRQIDIKVRLEMYFQRQLKTRLKKKVKLNLDSASVRLYEIICRLDPASKLQSCQPIRVFINGVDKTKEQNETQSKTKTKNTPQTTSETGQTQLH